MDKIIIPKLKNGEDLIGTFIATAKRYSPKWYHFLSPLFSVLSSGLFSETYIVGVTNMGLHIHKVFSILHGTSYKFYSWDEIVKLELGIWGIISLTLTLTFFDGQKLKLSAQLKGKVKEYLFSKAS